MNDKESGKKLITNFTNLPVTVILTSNKGGQAKSECLPPKNAEELKYGNSEDPFIKKLHFESKTYEGNHLSYKIIIDYETDKEGAGIYKLLNNNDHLIFKDGEIKYGIRLSGQN
ncbi:hypothetical protein [Xenorhabdus thuongxuanensis]|uniref:Uncharacterized protein n=1 Tax=Xenorhabdus thuongxuanensis TaxID=1873484 RepID=A0A1Q5TNR2_9GAMM|nr:hypothetical protein [Xenorhabdus thuongxuanensis]OKP01861.1 hypothetical protein Xentx_03304 [Xenorhabdus thuongxuanensis]